MLIFYFFQLFGILLSLKTHICLKFAPDSLQLKYYKIFLNFGKLQYKFTTTNLYNSSKFCSLLWLVFYMFRVAPTLALRFWRAMVVSFGIITVEPEYAFFRNYSFDLNSNWQISIFHKTLFIIFWNLTAF